MTHTKKIFLQRSLLFWFPGSSIWSGENFSKRVIFQIFLLVRLNGSSVKLSGRPVNLSGKKVSAKLEKNFLFSKITIFSIPDIKLGWGKNFESSDLSLFSRPLKPKPSR